MKLTAQVKLLPDPQQFDALHKTMEAVNAACQFISDRAWETQTFGQYSLHKLCYHETRSRFNLTAQVVVRAIAKVADAYKLDRCIKRNFRSTGAIGYDDRILRWYLDGLVVSIWTVAGRQYITFVCGPRQRELLQTRQGETDLIIFRDRFLLSATCNVEEPELIDVNGVLGVDLGIVNVAVDSDGTVHSSSQVNNMRRRYRRLRAKLQRKNTRSARRRLHKLSGKERRFATHTNHTISKRIVVKAQDTKRAIALEDLEGISTRITVRKPQRTALHSWSFFQLRSFIEYKGKLAGTPVLLVDPRNTSCTCPACGHIDKRNRPSQSQFLCVACGYADLADHAAALNIGRRAVIDRPDVLDHATSL